LGNFNGVGFRLLFSPLSKILSIHYFCLNPYAFTDSRKMQQDVTRYIEQQTTVESEYAPGVYLQRNKNVASRERDMDQIEVRNDIVFRVRHYIRITICMYSLSPKCTE
jgi:hypothetical protein